MKNIKREKGITMIALVMTIAILSLITVPIVINLSKVTEFNDYAKFKEDIDNLRENISTAFYDEDISSIGPEYKGSLAFLEKSQSGMKVKNDNDSGAYYAINIDAINQRLIADIKPLNYGEENSDLGIGSVYSGTDDVYIINAVSRTIYYVKRNLL